MGEWSWVDLRANPDVQLVKLAFASQDVMVVLGEAVSFISDVLEQP